MHLGSSLAGASLTLSVLSLGAVLVGWFGQTETPLGPVARIVDSLTPWLIGLCLVFAVVAVLLGARLIGGAMMLVALAMAATVFLTYRAHTLPLATTAQTEFRVLFFNLYDENTTPADEIIEAILAEAPDIAVLAESQPLHQAIPQLEAAFAFVLPCAEGACELLVASNLPHRRFWDLQLNPIWPERYAVIEIEAPDGRPVFLAASHLTKPWFQGVATDELDLLVAQYNWLTGPAVAVGDYNAAPWSFPMRRIFQETGFRAVRGQPASWPVAAGRFGVPIDQVLVRDGVVVTSVTPFGQGLGSNHMGFVVGLAVARD